MDKKRLEKLVGHALEIEEEEAKEAGTLGYMARVLVQATMPHSNPNISIFERTNGKLSLAIMGHPKIGLPYGTYPRLILAWIVTEAVRTREPNLILGTSLSQFMYELGLIPSGGRWGTISRLRDQMRRLFSSTISYVYEDEALSGGGGFNIAKEYRLWWDPKMPEQADLWESTVNLGKDFFEEIINRPVPIDLRAIKALKGSAMALDLYCWLTYRLSYLKETKEISWSLLQRQFGCDYKDNKQGRYDFKRKLLLQLNKVIGIYKGAAEVKEGEYGLILKPSTSHIRKLKM